MRDLRIATGTNLIMQKNQVLLNNGVVLTINTYKMYWNDDSYRINKYNAAINKWDFIRSIKEEDEYYKKEHGKIPAGFVIQCKVDTYDDSVCYGASIKSHQDKWDRMKGLKVAYSHLMSELSQKVELNKEDRLKIAQIVGLAK